jgi:hypothetical protein
MTKRKFLLFAICLFIRINLYSQANTFDLESKAFEFFKETILNKYPVKRKMTLWVDLERAKNDPYWYPRCLEKFKPEDSIIEVRHPTGRISLKDYDKDKFRIKSNGRGRLPVLFVNGAFTSKGLNPIVNITVLQKDHVDIYHMEFNQEGKIIDWCKGGYIY